MKDKLANMIEESEVSKGQFLSILVIVTLLFISGGSLFTTLFAKQQMNYVYSYFEGDMATISETKMRGEEFPEYINHQAQYAINNAALVLGQNGSYADWNKTHIPSKDYLMERYNETIVAHRKYGLRTNDFYHGCSVTPAVSFYNVTENYYRGADWIFVFNVDKKKIACGGGRWETKAIDRIEMSSYTGYDAHETINHNYIELSRYARNLSLQIREVIPETQTWGVASGTTSECDPTPSDRQDTRESVHQDARNNAIDHIKGVVQEAASETDKPSYFDVSADETASSWPRVDNPNNNTEVDCSLTHSHYNYSSICNTEDCTGDHTHSNSDGSSYDTYQNPGGDCSLPSYGAIDCKTHTHEHSDDPSILVKNEYDYNVSLATYYGNIDLTDNENQVVTHEGEVNIPFDFQYNHTINPSYPY